MSQSGAGKPPGGVRSAAGLAAVLLVCAVLIGTAWRFTREGIAENANQHTLAEIAAVLPAGLYDNEPHKDVVVLDTGGRQPLPVYRARRLGQPVAAAVTVDTPDGYQGPIRLLVGIGVDGRVLGVHVVSHRETPGIGAAVAEDASPWISRLTGRSLDDPPEPRWALRSEGGDFDAIAGATVSSRAVIGGVRHAVQYFNGHQEQIFGPPDRPAGTP
jgi:electron transport complex protein RnfG